MTDMTPENLTPDIVSTMAPILVPMVAAGPSSYIFYNRCILYISLIFGLLSLITLKVFKHKHRLFTNLFVGLLLAYFVLVLFNYSEYSRLSANEILFF